MQHKVTHLSSGTSTSKSWSVWWLKILTVWRGALLIEDPSPEPIPQPPPLCTDLPPCNSHTREYSNNKLQAIVHGSYVVVHVNVAASG